MVERNKNKKVGKRDVEEYPEPPKEHAYELKMEKRLKRMLTELKEKEAKK